MTFVIDPRRGDVEDDASSTKQRSMLSLAGSLLAEISLPKLVVAWVLLIGGPAVLIGIAPLALSIWIATASSKAAYALSGIGSLLLFSAIIAVSWFGGRRLLRMVEESFWSLNSLAVQPAYALVRELLRHVAEKLLPAKVSIKKFCAQEWPRWRVWRFSFPLSSWSYACGRPRCGSERLRTSHLCGGSSSSSRQQLSRYGKLLCRRCTRMGLR